MGSYICLLISAFAANPQSQHVQETSLASNKGKPPDFVIPFLLINYHDKAITMSLRNFQVWLRIDGSHRLLARPRKTRLLPITKVLGIDLPSPRI